MYYYAISLIVSVILLLNKSILTYFIGYRVEAPITYQLRAYALDVEKYEAVQDLSHVRR